MELPLWMLLAEILRKTSKQHNMRLQRMLLTTVLLFTIILGFFLKLVQNFSLCVHSGIKVTIFFGVRYVNALTTKQMEYKLLDDSTPTCNDVSFVTASPPNWRKHYQNTITSLASYKLFPVDPKTSEYATIAELLCKEQISTVEQIVNPMLWLRFVNTRKDMIKSKSTDLELLSQLQLSEEELMASYYYSHNFAMDTSVADVPYKDNMSLLFHCTRNVANIETILLHGLDDRMCSRKGLLGKGIYFTDNPKKSMQYDGCHGTIFIFAVLLGDCLYLDQPLAPTMSRRVKEPEKWPSQKRNVNDFFFDSIIARPSRHCHNEYVVYNRHQCYPLYKINYSLVASNPFAPNSIYYDSRKHLPPFSWQLRTANVPMPVLWEVDAWPFYTQTIFEKMGLKEVRQNEL